ncbi:MULTISPECIES: hypothetical protein [Sphingobacterium]|uniref:hypothetical protein n=1 Tax=Sphingobacterium TaxID=28453 RepID=UPI00200BF953|nr:MULTISPECIES: hypothetical protein [Sphingobacterium]UQA74227.1 hypothetical protein K2F45_20800 [Sphingobacterium siyangense]
MKTSLVMLLLMFYFTGVKCQLKDEKKAVDDNYPVINIAKKLDINQVIKIELYRFNPKKKSNQSKAISIVYNNRIAPCFDYIRTIKDKDKFIKIITDHHTYGSEDIACFDTGYSVLLYGNKDDIVGYINISMSCNKLISNPEIKERTYYSRDGLRKVGFSKKGKISIQKILGI